MQVTINEICVCAAVKCTDGTIIRGHRHNDCFVAIRTRNKEIMRGSDAQGFITSTGRFVGRAEGAKLMSDSGLKSVWSRDGSYGAVLCSEDLY
jgi:hypothetical protein